ncbi:hypothetical protein [uncultured Gammaproteobacteria bacterium]|jgi:predicted DNA binding CopG/RHH family protein|uniref:Uncharacterized protein n=2 Tax=sulfur-oxidizing symbionts TaxID=32036 RepID=A0A1H6K1K6_9GAMM|nr:hypothetical protein [Bathymodiolus thermophilus thioautotrophic gill symbiont]CAC9493597.1 hypothetical protein [uncultured Gammaproteobacteria bacterium]SEH65274.1 hypothetical protein BAZSYMB_SCAFFOLD00082_4 [Bathymodiolus azoricus thioautotrophic gill symbiont]CAB5508130.1 hypothetical protein AZO1586I_2405 [Bathymodiolus thermophilus thioautotrophic gill symbiont]CAC9538380.1 hypothetical protein [uncultured Gammaproteobacteria bacterium]CAC9557198.1 hypothetical protein [uncultured Ga
MSKNNLDGIEVKKRKVLPKSKSKAGRPTTNPNEKESETIALKVTPLELAAVKEKAGVAGLSTYIKHYIRTNTELFK